VSVRKRGHSTRLSPEYPVLAAVPREGAGSSSLPSQDRGSSTGAGACVVEFVGPAGAGKTSLINALRQRDPTLRAPIRISHPRYFAPAALEAVCLMPVLIRDLSRASACAWSDTRYLLEVNTLRRAVESACRRDARPILLDEGPVFVLARGIAFRSTSKRDIALHAAWMRGIRAWGRMLDVIIWLDAPDDVLADRIRGRRKAHRAKESGDAELSAFLGKYRRAYDWVIDQFAATGQTRLYRFDTSELAIERLADAATRVIEGATRA
jgi:hypothetical protein